MKSFCRYFNDTDGVIVLSAGWRDTSFWWEQLKDTEQLEGLGVNASIILKWIISKWVEGREVE